MSAPQNSHKLFIPSWHSFPCQGHVVQAFLSHLPGVKLELRMRGSEREDRTSGSQIGSCFWEQKLSFPGSLGCPLGWWSWMQTGCGTEHSLAIVTADGNRAQPHPVKPTQRRQCLDYFGRRIKLWKHPTP